MNSSGGRRVERQVCQDLGGLRLRQSVVHCPVQVIGQLRGLSRRDQGAHSDETPVPRRQIGTPPEIPEQHVCGVLHDPRCDGAELLADALRAFGLRGLVERQQLHGRRGELIDANVALCEGIFRNASGRECIGPASVERQVRDGLRDLAWLDPVLNRLVQVIGQWRRLIAGNQRRDVRPDALSSAL